MDNLLKTPLYDIYDKYGARVVDFAGWALPVQFSGIVEEHNTVRTKAGLFDVSHMGEILVFGSEATNFLDYLLANEIASLKEGKIRYAHMCNHDGGVVDDILVYRFDTQEYMLVVNASNIQKDLKWIKSHAPEEVSVEDVSEVTAQLAIQGPMAENILKRLTSFETSSMIYYSFERNVVIAEHRCILSRTGYTGEDGFEIYCSPSSAVDLWEALMEAGKDFGICAAGLGARDTLRFEACMPLYGHELAEDISPLESGLDRYVRLNKQEFIGRNALARQAAEGLKKRLIGLEMVDRGIPRNGYKVLCGDRETGYVTTGSYCPTLQKNMAMAMVEAAHSEIGDEFYIEIRDKAVKARAAEIPFYRRQLV